MAETAVTFGLDDPLADESLPTPGRSEVSFGTDDPAIEDKDDPEFLAFLDELVHPAAKLGPALVETGLQLATGAVATPIAGLAGIGASVLPGGKTGAEAVEDVQGALTFQPRTKAGKALSADIAKPFELFDRLATRIGEISGEPSDVLGATMVKTAIVGATGGFLRPKRARAQAQVQKARDNGYTLQPTTKVEGKSVGTVTQRVAERVAGKALVPAAASIKNQRVTNRLAAQSVGLKGETISGAAIKRLREEANAKYRQLQELDANVNLDAQFAADLQAVREAASSALRGGKPDARVNKLIKALEAPEGTVSIKNVLDEVQQLRRDSRINFRKDDPKAELMARSQRASADALEAALARSVEKVNPTAVAEWRAARVQLAKLHQLEEALVGSDISAIALAKARDKGAPLTGELSTIADVADFFPRVVQSGDSIASKAGIGVATTVGGPAAAIAFSEPSLALIPVARLAAKRVATQPAARPALTAGAAAVAGVESGTELSTDDEPDEEQQ